MSGKLHPTPTPPVALLFALLVGSAALPFSYRPVNKHQTANANGIATVPLAKTLRSMTAIQRVLLEKHDDPLPPQNPELARCVVISDTHGRHSQIRDLPSGDVLIHLGDVANKGKLRDIHSFASWMRTFPHPEKIVLDGNHDRDRRDPSRIDTRKEYDGVATVLRDQVVELADGRLRVLGVSWDSCERDDYSLAAELSERSNVDLLLTHINPYVKGQGHGWHGSLALTELVRNRRIPLHCFGHVHYGRGICTNVGGGHDNGVMVNCATAWNKIVVIDFCPIEKQATMIHCPGRRFSPPGEKFILSHIK